MGILDELGKSLGMGGQQAAAGQPAGGAQGALLQTVMGLLAGGGLQQLVSSFEQKGLGDVVGSWISTGPNKPVSPDQVQHALGQEQLGKLAQQTGIDHGALAGQLSQLLPTLVDRLTPNGRLPEGSALQERLGSLVKGLF